LSEDNFVGIDKFVYTKLLIYDVNWKKKNCII